MGDNLEPLSDAEIEKIKSQYESHVDYAGEHGFGHSTYFEDETKLLATSVPIRNFIQERG